VRAAIIIGPGVRNGDFESDTRASTSSTGQINGASTFWTDTSGLVGVLNVTGNSSQGVADTNFNSGFYPTNVSNGTNNGLYEGFTQTIGTTYSNITTTDYQSDMTYAVSVLFGDSYETPSPASVSGTFELLDATTHAILASDSVPYPSAGHTTPVSFSYDTATTGAGVGDPLQFSFISGTNQTSAIDDVVVSSSVDASVPEPVGMSMLAIAGAGLLRRRRLMA
jgi:MYXO-CTERM domain-containing protein